jgi:poly-gamma-glutamate synthesis protein (capsule biosynthesis protein)
MLGRGVDQILPTPSDPRLFEPVVHSALEYVKLAEDQHGPIPRPVAFEYVWGDALSELESIQPTARIINLETAITTSGDPWSDKEIHYRMHPANIPCLKVAGIDCCVLANNHVLDWGRTGLDETLTTLHRAGIQTAGAGHDEKEGASPSVITASAATRILVYAFAVRTSGVPRNWRARRGRPGVNLLENLSPGVATDIGRRISSDRRSGDIVVASLHWGGNWGYAVSKTERDFAHRLIDTAGVDVVHGHSSHHVKGIEVYERKVILYGCGDLLNDYEGISGYEAFRGDLALMYFPTLESDRGDLLGLCMVPTQTRRLRINGASPDDTRWLAQRMDRECTRFGTRVTQASGHTLVLEWER